MEQKGYVGLTDPDWSAYLTSLARVDEVNFWQPHGGRAFRALRPGDPFFFKLRAPHKAIAGFGFFEHYELLPAWLTWDLFGNRSGQCGMAYPYYAGWHSSLEMNGSNLAFCAHATWPCERSERPLSNKACFPQKS